MATWTKVDGKWLARGTWLEFVDNSHVYVIAKDGRETCCVVTGSIPALVPENVEPTEAHYNRTIVVEVKRETRSYWEIMSTVPRATRPY